MKSSVREFCLAKGDDWCCYNHPILCPNVKDGLLAEVEQLILSIGTDLEGNSKDFKIRYYLNLTAPA
jgi:hypothetical protein